MFIEPVYKIYITAYPARNMSGEKDIIERLEWDEIPFKLWMRWQWYFKLRYAMMVVKYPKKYVTWWRGQG